MKTKHNIILGDSRSMAEVENESIHLVITSPPYWQLKDYGDTNQIGFNQTYEQYINNLNLVWNECHRVLYPGCRLCINIGDQFARSVYYGRYKIIPIRTEIIKFCETIGFDYMGSIIWQKVTTCNTSGGASIMGSFPYPRNGIIKLDYEFILIFKKIGESPIVSKDIKEQSKLTTEDWNKYFVGHWNFSGEKQDKHLAMFPEELPKRLIKMFSFVGENVLDPFLGSGTTSLAAKNLERNSFGYEINDDFLPVIKDKLCIGLDLNFNDAEHKIIKSKNNVSDYSDKIEKLPYIFKDPIKINAKIDIKKLNFGSKIDNIKTEPVDSYVVKEIVSPEFIKLNNGLTIKLIGIKTNKSIETNALKYLNETVKGKRIFLKYDNIKYDKDNNLMCYVYLYNKTFINAHLIKKGLASVDTNIDFSLKSKFSNLLNLGEQNG